MNFFWIYLLLVSIKKIMLFSNVFLLFEENIDWTPQHALQLTWQSEGGRQEEPPDSCRALYVRQISQSDQSLHLSTDPSPRSQKHRALRAAK